MKMNRPIASPEPEGGKPDESDEVRRAGSTATMNGSAAAKVVVVAGPAVVVVT